MSQTPTTPGQQAPSQTNDWEVIRSQARTIFEQQKQIEQLNKQLANANHRAANFRTERDQLSTDLANQEARAESWRDIALEAERERDTAVERLDELVGDLDDIKERLIGALNAIRSIPSSDTSK
jgi:chromosome segregation ATPase